MHTRCLSAPWVRAWKTWAPILNTAFFSGVGVWYWYYCSGPIPVIDGLVTMMLAAVVVQSWWIARVLMRVEIDEYELHVSDLNTVDSISLPSIVKVIDRTRLKRIPTTIVIDPPAKFGNKIRFFPARPSGEVIAELRSHIPSENKSCQQDEEGRCRKRAPVTREELSVFGACRRQRLFYSVRSETNTCPIHEYTRPST